MRIASGHLRFITTKVQWPQPLAHAEFGHHAPSQVGDLLDVVCGAGGDLSEHQLLGHPPTQRHHHTVVELSSRGEVAILLRQGQRPAQRLPPGHDRHSMHRVGVVEHPTQHRVPGLVIGDGELVGLRHHPAVTRGARHHTVDRLGQVGFGNLVAPLPGGQDGSLVDHVGQVGAGETGGTSGEYLQVDPVGERLALRVHLEDGKATGQVGKVHHHLTIEAPGTKQRRVEDVGPVGRRHQDHTGGRIEPVHLHQQLVEGLLAFVVAATHAGTPVPADRIDLVHEDDRRCVRLGLLEQVPHTTGTNSDKHLDEVRPGQRHERNPGLPRHRASQQRLAGARRAEQQHTLGNAGAHRSEAIRVGQKVSDLRQFGHGLVGPGHVGEGHLGVHGSGLGTRAPDAEPTDAPTLHVHHEVEKRSEHQHGGPHVQQQVLPP